MTFPAGKVYDIVLADPPWYYYGDPNKNAAAGKHYNLMTQDELAALPVRDIMKDKAALFLWSTCPRLDFAIDMINRWGLHYRGVAWIWVKINAKQQIIKGQGIPPTFVKPNAELVLAATTHRTGRPFSIHDFAQSQIILARREHHSRKPGIVRDNIVKLCGDLERIELFATERVPGWDAWGDSLPGKDMNEEATIVS